MVRVPKAYPHYDYEYQRNVETIVKYLDSVAPNIHPVGRNGMHKYNNQDHSMYTAMLTVENILGASTRHLGGERRGGVPRADDRPPAGQGGTGRDAAGAAPPGAARRSGRGPPTATPAAAPAVTR